jgi:hypothetical protein
VCSLLSKRVLDISETTVKRESALAVAPDPTYQSSATPKTSTTIAMNENDSTATLSPALEWAPVDEAVLVDNGWKALSMLVRRPPIILPPRRTGH